MAEEMPAKQPLTPQLCQSIVVQSTPDPHKFAPDSDPTVVTLFDLGVVGARESALFVKAVQKRLCPWVIDDADVASSPDTTVQKSANSLAQNVQ